MDGLDTDQAWPGLAWPGPTGLCLGSIPSMTSILILLVFLDRDGFLFGMPSG